jgi:hypothetical protein
VWVQVLGGKILTDLRQIRTFGSFMLDHHQMEVQWSLRHSVVI